MKCDLCGDCRMQTLSVERVSEVRWVLMCPPAEPDPSWDIVIADVLTQVQSELEGHHG